MGNIIVGGEVVRNAANTILLVGEDRIISEDVENVYDAAGKLLLAGERMATGGSETVSIPSNISVPVISGTLTQGSQLTCSSGTWAGGSLSYSYAWFLAGEEYATGNTCTAAEGDLYCEVTATNTAGSATASSTAVQVGSPPLAPESISGLAVDWDPNTLAGADNSAVAALADSSGNGRGLSQATGTAQPKLRTSYLNGASVLEFDNNDFLDVSTPFDLGGSEYTIFGAARHVTTTSIRLLWSDTTTLYVGFEQGALILNDAGSNPDDVEGAARTRAGGWFNFVLTGSASGRKIWMNGRHSSSYSVAAGTGLRCARVCRISGSTGFNWAGHVARLGGYNRTLTDTEALQLSRWMNDRYEAVAPTHHLIVDGNSLSTQPSGAGVPWPALLYDQSEFATWSVDNFAVSGQSTTAMVADAAAQVVAAKKQGIPNVCVAWEWTNHIANVGATEQQAWDAMVAYAAIIRAAGIPLLTGTIIARRDFTVGERAIVDAINARLRTSDLAQVADGLIDFAANPEFDTQADAENATYYLAVDGIHLTTAGNTILANTAKPVILAAAGL